MKQYIGDLLVEIVDLQEMPTLPITGLTPAEEKWGLLHEQHGRTCAHVLTEAIERGIVTTPGKYAIHFVNHRKGPYCEYQIFAVNE